MNVETLPDLLEQRATATPEALAFTGGGESVSWRELAERVDAFAAALRELGLRPGDVVAVLGQTTGEWIVADLGILEAGGVCVGLYPTLPAEQMAAVLEDCGAKIVTVGSRAELEIIEALSVPTVEKVIGWGDAETCASFSFRALVSAGRTRDARNATRRRDDTALVVYTSGTTGELKGAALSHGNCLAAVEGAMAAAPYAGESDVAVSFLPMAHVAEHIALYGRIATGMATHFVGSLDGAKVREAILLVRPTLLGAVPLIFEKAYQTIQKRVNGAPRAARALFRWAERIAREMSRARRANGPPSLALRLRHAIANVLVLRRIRAALGGRIRYCVCGAAPIDPGLLEFFHGAGILILEAYGLTEFSGIATMNRPDAYRFGTVGLPLPGVEVRIAGDGEVLLRGPTVFRGYLNRMEETSSVLDGDGWLRTGDIGEIDGDGFLRLTDRKKNLIATAGGKKIAPVRIEAMLSGEPLFGSVVVVGDARAYVTALVDLEPEAQSLPRNEIESRVRDAFERANASLAPFERVRRAFILSRPLSIENGELTATFKVRRSIVSNHRRDEIERLYEEPLQPGVIEIVAPRG